MGRNWVFQRWPFLRVGWCVAVSGTAVLALAAVRVAEGAEGPSIQQALAVYSQITSRTLLRQSFGSEFLALSAPLTGDTNAIANFIEKELGELGFEIIPDGKRFARVVRKGWRGSEAEKFLSRIPPPPEEDPPNAKPGEMLEAGSIDYKGVDFQMVLKIYAEYRGRAVLRPTGLSTAPLWLTTQTPLSKAGIVYAHNVVFALNGIAAVDDGDKFVQLAIFSKVRELKLNAPKLGPGEALIKPEEVPEFRLGRTIYADPSKAPPREDATAGNVLSYYARLADRVSEPSAELEQRRVLFEAMTPMTKAELLYGLETALSLNGLAVVAEGEKAVRLGLRR